MIRAARVSLASTPRDRFLQRMEAIRTRIDRLPDDAVREALDDLDAARRRVLGELAGAQDFNAIRLQQLTGRIGDVMDDFAARYSATLAPYQQEMAALGQALVAEPVVQAGLTFGVPQIPRRLVEATIGFQADLVAGLSDDGTRKITQAIRLGTIQGKSVFEVMKDVAGSLESPGAFASITARAEAITRTELGRIQAIAADATLRSTQQLVPGLQKQWQHSLARLPRPTHLAYNGTVKDIDDFYEVAPNANAPREQLLYPRDPRGSAANTVNCGCLSLPYKADWPA